MTRPPRSNSAGQTGLPTFSINSRSRASRSIPATAVATWRGSRWRRRGVDLRRGRRSAPGGRRRRGLDVALDHARAQRAPRRAPACAPASGLARPGALIRLSAQTRRERKRARGWRRPPVHRPQSMLDMNLVHAYSTSRMSGQPRPPRIVRGATPRRRRPARPVRRSRPATRRRRTPRARPGVRSPGGRRSSRRPAPEAEGQESRAAGHATRSRMAQTVRADSCSTTPAAPAVPPRWPVRMPPPGRGIGPRTPHCQKSPCAPGAARGRQRTAGGQRSTPTCYSSTWMFSSANRPEGIRQTVCSPANMGGPQQIHVGARRPMPPPMLSDRPS